LHKYQDGRGNPALFEKRGVRGGTGGGGDHNDRDGGGSGLGFLLRPLVRAEEGKEKN